MSIRRPSGEKHGIGVPGNGGDGGADGFLEVLGDPPVVFFFEVADGYEAGAGAGGEFGFGGGPADGCSGAVYAQEHESGFPACGGGFPDVGVAVYISHVTSALPCRL